MTLAQTSTYFAPIVDASAVGVDRFQPEDFRPLPGYVLAVQPPKDEATPGGIIKPDKFQQDKSVARVCAVPADPKCPFKPGDWVVFLKLSAMKVEFGGRDDLRILQYADDGSGDIQGFFLDPTVAP